SPRLQIYVAQPREPRVARRQFVELLEEAEGNDERRKRVRDRRIAPVQHPQPLASSKDICHVQVVVLNRLGHLACGQFAAQLRKAWGKLPEPVDLMTVERQVTVQQIVVARRPRRDSQIRYSVCEVIANVWRLAALELGVEW